MRGRLIILAGAVAATALAAPAGARPSLAPPLPAPRVTGVLQPPSAYLAQGLAPRAAARLMQLDQMARSGVSLALLNGALAGTQHAASSESAPTQVYSFVEPAGNLDGRGADEVLDTRFTSRGSHVTVQVVARDGATGRSLWSRTDRFTDDTVEFALGTTVAGRPGVVLVRYPLKTPEVLIALDGRGEKAWQRALPDAVDAPAPPPAVGVITLRGRLHYSFLYFDTALRRGQHEILRIEGDIKRAQGDAGGGVTGAVAYSAIDATTGALRSVPGGERSSDGLVVGDTAGDADGDGYLDLVTAAGGNRHSVAVTRALDGRTAWSRSDAFSDDLAGMGSVDAVTGERTRRGLVGDVVLLTTPRSLPVEGLSSPLGPGNQALLLAGRTGRTAWSKPGDGVYLPGVSGGRALGVWTDGSSTAGAEDVAQADVTVYDGLGRTRWHQTYRRTHPKQGTADQALVLVGTWLDFDGDGGREGVVLFLFLNEKGGEGTFAFFRNSDGKVIAEPQDSPLGARVRPGHDDVVRVTPSAAGLVVSVSDARSRSLVWRRLVPGTKGLKDGLAFASPLTHHACADVLVSGQAGARTAIAVLASTGDLRWSVVRSGEGLGSVLRPSGPPRLRC